MPIALSIMKKILLVLLIVLLLLAIYRIIHSIKDTYSSFHHAERLKQELVQKQRKNTFLKERLEYVRTDSFINEQARDQLGLVQKDEFVILAPPPKETPLDMSSLEQLPTWKKWIKIFFSSPENK